MSIVVEDYHKTYGATTAVAGLTFRAEPGEILGLVGPNGAGKTTTLRALAGILTPTRGRLLLDGHDLAREPVQAKAVLAYIPDEPKLFDQLTVWEHLRFIAEVYRVSDWRTRAEELLRQFELVDKRDWPQPVRELVRRVFSEDLAAVERAQSASDGEATWRAIVRDGSAQ